MRFAVAHRHGCVSLQQHKRKRLSHGIPASDDNHVFAGDVYVVVIQHFNHGLRGCGAHSVLTAVQLCNLSVGNAVNVCADRHRFHKRFHFLGQGLLYKYAVRAAVKQLFKSVCVVGNVVFRYFLVQKLNAVRRRAFGKAAHVLRPLSAASADRRQNRLMLA